MQCLCEGVWHSEYAIFHCQIFSEELAWRQHQTAVICAHRFQRRRMFSTRPVCNQMWSVTICHRQSQAITTLQSSSKCTTVCPGNYSQSLHLIQGKAWVLTENWLPPCVESPWLQGLTRCMATKPHNGNINGYLLNPSMWSSQLIQQIPKSQSVGQPKLSVWWLHFWSPVTRLSGSLETSSAPEVLRCWRPSTEWSVHSLFCTLD